MNTYEKINGMKKVVVTRVEPNENEETPMKKVIERVNPYEIDLEPMIEDAEIINCEELSTTSDDIFNGHDGYVNQYLPNNYSIDYMRCTPYIPTPPFFYAGVSFAQAQRLNEQIIHGRIAVDNLHELNVERFSYKRALDEFKIQKGRETGMITNEAGDIIPFPNNPNINLREFEQSYIDKYAIVKVRSRCKSKYSYMIRAIDEHRHIPIEDNDFKTNYFDEMDLLPNSDVLSKNARENSFRRMKSLIPKLQNVKLHILNEYEVMFADGYLNLKTMNFTPVEDTQQNKYFNLFSIEIQYGNGKYDKPKVFDAFLRLILDNAEPACKGIYQMIGSILAPAPSFKKCYLLQGLSNSGKTTLVNYIMKLISDEDTMDFNTIADLTNMDSLTKPLRLIHIKELGSNKLASKQIVSIKSFVDGSSPAPGSSSFKIIMTTNHKITTGKGDLIENGLKNRLLVIPFPKTIDFNEAEPDIQVLEDVFFDQERRGIILTALSEYSEVLRTNGKFCCNYEVNTVVEASEEDCQGLTDEERASIADAISQNQASPQPVLDEIFDSCFVIADHINPDMTTEIVMNTVNHVRNGLLVNAASTGRKLSEHFGKRLRSERPNGNMAYNLEFKTPQSSAETENN